MPVTRRQFIKYLSAAAAMLASESSIAKRSKRHFRVIPSSGEMIPAIGLGSWLTFAIDLDDKQELQRRIGILQEFLQLGGGMIDSSPMYGVAQDVIGKGLNSIGHEKARKQGLFSATKVWTSGQRAGFLQMEESLALWGLQGFDLMQVHNLVDWETHLPNLHEMKQQGELRYVGVTTSHGRRHEELIKLMKTQTLDFVQFTYNIVDREAEQYLLPLAKEKGIAVIINRPFQRGGLFEKFEHQPLPGMAKDIECKNWAQFFLKFVISHPAVTCAIPATSQLPHLQENMAAAYGQLPGEAMRKEMALHIDSL